MPEKLRLTSGPATLVLNSAFDEMFAIELERITLVSPLDVRYDREFDRDGRFALRFGEAELDPMPISARRGPLLIRLLDVMLSLGFAFAEEW